MKVIKSNYEGNPNIGLFMFCNDKLCLIGHGFRDDQKRDIERSLNVPSYSVKVLSSNLVGLFIAGNNKGIVVPDKIEDHEFQIISEICAKHEMRIHKIKSPLNALGNNVLCNDTGCIVNPEFGNNEIKDLEKALDVHVEKGTIASFENVGSLARVTNKGSLVTEDILPEEKENVEAALHCQSIEGSVNNSRYISSGIIANERGCIVSDTFLGGETLLIKEAFFSEDE